MDHGLSIENRVRADLLKIAKDLKLPLVATNDLHYAAREDAAAHEVLLCVQSGSTMADANRFKFDGDGYYLKSPAEMRALFAELPEACDNTLAIAERCDISFTEGAGTFMPRYPCPPGENEESWFVREVETGLRRRFPLGIPDDVRQQAKFETEVILSMGFAGYFLVVADFINWAKENGIRVGPGRGSGAGSMAAYAMRITDLDPLEHGLIFERFLNPDRVSMPDFDIDFDERRRGEVIRYVTDKYGEDRVSQIVTYGTIKAKQAVKDASRVLGYPFAVGERITKAMPPPVMGKDVPLSGLFDPEHKRYSRGRGVPGPGRRRRRGRQGGRDRARAGGSEAAVGRARGRRDHVVRPADRHHPDHAPRAGRRDHHPARLPDVRGARADQDGLPRAAQPHRARRRRRQHPAQPGLRAGAGGPGADRPRDVRAAGPRRHPRGVPARRRADAVAAEADAPGQLRGHLGRAGALPARADGRRQPHQLRAAQEQPPGDHPDPPRAGGAAGRDPGHHATA